MNKLNTTIKNDCSGAIDYIKELKKENRKKIKNKNLKIKELKRKIVFLQETQKIEWNPEKINLELEIKKYKKETNHWIEKFNEQLKKTEYQEKEKRRLKEIIGNIYKSYFKNDHYWLNELYEMLKSNGDIIK